MEHESPARGPQRVGQGMPAVAPVGPAELHAVPFDARPLQQLIQGERLAHDVAPQPECGEPLDEALQADVPFQQPPVEPVSLTVEAIGVVVAALAATDLAPMSSIGVPADSSSTVRKFFTWRLRSASTSGSSVGPSTPQFQLRFSSEPSRCPRRSPRCASGRT